MDMEEIHEGRVTAGKTGRSEDFASCPKGLWKRSLII